MSSTARSRLPSVFLPAAAVVTIGAVDRLLAARRWPLWAVAVLDESAHLLTAGLTVAALHRPTDRSPSLPWVLAGAVLLDLDHVPMYLGADVSAGKSGGRPVTHSLSTVAALLGAAAAVRRFRVPLAGLAAGAATQLWRDLSSDPGVPLAWPVLPDDVRVPWPAYGSSLVALAGVSTWRRLAGRRRDAVTAGPQER